MYEQIFNFHSRPFTSTPYVDHYFAAEAIHQALAQVRMCIERAQGPAIITGASGTGKSLLLAMLAEQYQAQFNVVNLACARLDQRADLLQSILFELKQPYKDMSEGELRLTLIDSLKPSEHCPNGILLLVDEADSLPVGLLEEMRLITNFVRDGQPRVRLVMAGSHRLEENLNNPKLESFSQRIGARCYLTALSRDETENYVRTHIDRVGGNGAEMFPSGAARLIHEQTDGVPRLINQVCDHAMIAAGTQGATQVTERMVHQAWADVQNIPTVWTEADSVGGPPIQQDEEWTVIEFGTLDDDDKASADSSAGLGENQGEEITYEFTSKVNEDGSPQFAGDAPASSLEGTSEQNQASEFESDHIDVMQMQQEREPESLTFAESENVVGETVEQQLEETAGNLLMPESSTMAVQEMDETDKDELARLTAMLEEQQSNASSSSLELTADETMDPGFAESLAENELPGLSEDSANRLLSPSGLVDSASSLMQQGIAPAAGLAAAGVAGLGASDAVAIDVPVDPTAAPDPFMSPDPPFTPSSTPGEPQGTPADSPQSEPGKAAQDILNALKAKQEQRTAETQALSDTPVTPEANEVETETTQVEEYSNPFDEEFSEEEQLAHFAPMIAEQNLRSLTVTAEQLESIRPEEERVGLQNQTTVQHQPGVLDQSGIQDEIANQAASEAESSQVTPEFENLSVIGSVTEEEPANEALDLATANILAGMSEPQNDKSPVDAGGLLEPSAELQPAEVQPTDVQPAEEALPADQALAKEMVGRDTLSDMPEQEQSEIERRAEEILQAIRMNEIAQPADEVRQDAQIAAEMENLEAMTSDILTPGAVVPFPTTEADQSATDTETTQGGRNDAQEMLDSMLRETKELTAEVEEQRESVPIEYSMETEKRGDDRDMLIVTQVDQLPTPEVASEEDVLTSATPSTGRAERMDYQALFDQLRNIPDSE